MPLQPHRVAQRLHRLRDPLAHADALRQRPDDLVRIALFELVIADVLQYEVVNRCSRSARSFLARPRQPGSSRRVDRLPVRAVFPLSKRYSGISSI